MENNGCSTFFGCLFLTFFGCLLIIGLLVTPPAGWVILLYIIIRFWGEDEFWDATTNRPSVPKPTSSSSNPVVTVAPDDINNILVDISQGEIKDIISQENFRPGEKVYLCLTHRLAYHEDSWQFNGYQCSVCGHGNNTKTYILPTPIDLRQIRWEEDLS